MPILSNLFNVYEKVINWLVIEVFLLLAAAQWCRTHDPSEGFLMMLSEVLKNLGYESIIERL
jgi:hypothetical protein